MVPSYTGAFTSVLISVIVAIYGLSKFVQLLNRQNPNISSWTENDAIDPDALINMRDTKIRIAFGISGYLD